MPDRDATQEPVIADQAQSEKPPTVAGVFVPFMHGLRGWAILIVFLFHVTLAVRYIPTSAVPRALVEGSGFLALDVLFFTTGFVLFLPVALSGNFGSVRSFAIRRFLRIAPTYYVCLLVILLAYPVLTSDAMASAASNGVVDYIIHLTFLQRELLPSGVGLGVNGPLWALSMDVIFYLLLPLIANAYIRRPLVGLGAAFAISLTWRLLVNEPITRPDLLIQFPLFCADFATGMTAAWLFVRIKREEIPVNPRAAVAVAAGALLAVVGLVYAAGSTIPYHAAVFQGADAAMLAFPLALGLFVMAAALAPAWASWPLTNRAVMWLGEVNFSIYLYHVLAMNFALVTLGLSTDGSKGALVEMMLVATPITLALALLSYRFVEVPSRRYGRGLARRAARSRAPEPTTADTRTAALGGATPD